MGFFSGLRKGLDSPDTGLRIQAALAAMSGDTGAVMRMRSMMEDRQRRADAAARLESLQNNLVKDREHGGYGLDPGEAERVMTDPESFGREYNTRFRTVDQSPGERTVIPNGGQPPTIVANPTTDEQQARAIGLEPGTEPFNLFMRDSVLGAQGPTGTETTRRGQDVSRDNNVRSNATAVRNTDVRERGATARHNTPAARPPTPQVVLGAILAKQASGQPLTPAEQAVLDQSRAPRGGRTAAPPAGRAGGGQGAIIVNPRTGVRMQLQNGRWVRLP